jgi:hypothetical protein
MRTTKYYQVSNLQLFIMAVLVGVIAAALITINTTVRDYLQLPVVTMASDDKCVAVANYRNGETFTCSDVGTVLRNYRVKKN